MPSRELRCKYNQQWQNKNRNIRNPQMKMPRATYIWSLFWRHVATCEQCVVWCLAIGWVILFSIEQSGRVFCGVFTPSCWPSHSHPAPHHRHYTITSWCFLQQTRISSYLMVPLYQCSAICRYKQLLKTPKYFLKAHHRKKIQVYEYKIQKRPQFGVWNMY